MRVLVTGGGGWIGSATCRQIEARGGTPVVFDRTVGADIRNLDQLLAFADGCSNVIHLAGVLGTHELFDTPQHAVEVNVGGTLNVLEACRKTGAAYTGIVMPKVNPSLYSATKNCGADIANAYREAHGIAVSHVIAYNAFGPGQAHGPGHPQKIVPTFAVEAWAGRPIPVWGDGDLWTDLVHVDDVARMLVDATFFSEGEIFDAGTGDPLTVLEVARQVHDITGPTGILHMPPRVGERKSRTRDDFASGRGWDLVGWRPERTTEQMVEAVTSYRTVAAAA